MLYFLDNIAKAVHEVISREDEGLNYVANKTALVDIGTDPQTATQIYNHEAKTLILEDSKQSVLVGEKFGPTSKSITLVTKWCSGFNYRKPDSSSESCGGYQKSG